MNIARRRLLRVTCLATAAQLLARSPARAADVWSVDAAGIRVAPGLWPASTPLLPGVHFENVRLRMPDGVWLNALLYLPGSVKSGHRAGTQLCVDPYRGEPNGWLANDLARQAQEGFAAMFLDVRGTGGSEGSAPDEYMPAEYDDTVHVIEWLARQPWSNGAVGMYGTSYSAFNSVWTAANYKPPALKAIFVRGGTDDRYTDDIHSPGGIMMMVDGSWALGMITDNAMPGAPDYDLNGAAALARWNTPPWIVTYLNNQTDGPHYRRGSLAPDKYNLLTTPTFLGGGYLDMYQNFVPRIMKNSPAYTQGVLGSFHHSMTWPGPVLDWHKLQSRWFGHFLNGDANGVMQEPRVSYYMPRWRRQHFRDAGAIAGEWRYANSWPDSVFDPGKRFFLRPRDAVPLAVALRDDPAPSQGGDLADMAPPASALKLRYYPTTGGTTESIGPDSYEGFFGLDSRADDVWGLAFDTPALREDLEILGFVQARLFVASTAPVATWIVRVNDVAPDGTSYIVTYGFLNGTHRNSHVTPQALPINETVELNFSLFCTGYHFSPGHRIRVVVTNAYFPVVWPSPYPMVTTLFTGGEHASSIALPVLTPSPSLAGDIPLLGDHADATTERANDLMSGYQFTRDYVKGAASAHYQMGPSVIGCEVSDGDPARAALTISTSEKNTPLLGHRVVETQTQGSLRSTQDRFLLDVHCTLLENGKVIRKRTWQADVKRELV
jgi:putative CocE/NonD family hydrolase